MVLVSLTPEGETAVANVPAVLAEVMNLHLKGFMEAEWLTLKGLLNRMAETGDTLRDMA